MNVPHLSALYFISCVIHSCFSVTWEEKSNGDSNSEIEYFKTANFAYVNHEKCKLEQQASFSGSVKMEIKASFDYSLHTFRDAEGRCTTILAYSPSEEIRSAKSITAETQILLELYHPKCGDILEHVGLYKPDGTEDFITPLGLIHIFAVILKKECIVIKHTSSFIVTVFKCKKDKIPNIGSKFWKKDEKVKGLDRDKLSWPQSGDIESQTECYPVVQEGNVPEYPPFAIDVNFGMLAQFELIVIAKVCKTKNRAFEKVSDDLGYEMITLFCTTLDLTATIVTTASSDQMLLMLISHGNNDVTSAVGVTDPSSDKTIHHINVLLPNACTQYTIDTKDDTAHVSNICGSSYKIAPKSWKVEVLSETEDVSEDKASEVPYEGESIFEVDSEVSNQSGS